MVPIQGEFSVGGGVCRGASSICPSQPGMSSQLASASTARVAAKPTTTPQRRRRAAQSRTPGSTKMVSWGLIVSHASTKPAVRSRRASSSLQATAIKKRINGVVWPITIVTTVKMNMGIATSGIAGGTPGMVFLSR